MIKITRGVDFKNPPLSGPASPGISKRGFKSNNMAGLLRKRYCIEPKEQENDDGEPSRSSVSLSDLSKDGHHSASISQDSPSVKENQDNNMKETINLQPLDLNGKLTDNEGKSLPQKFSRVMIIGSRDTGKRTFVNNLFSFKNSTVSSRKQNFDLITKICNEETYVKRYNFWLKEPSDLTKDYYSIFKMYYKTCSVFFLMYNPEDRESFFNLEKELRLLNEAKLDKEKCVLALIARKRNGSLESKVLPEEVEEIKEKYGCKLCFELNDSEEINQSLLNIIEQSSKQMF